MHVILLQYKVYLCNICYTFSIYVITLQYKLYLCNTCYTFAICYTFAMHVIPLQYMLYLCNTCYTFAIHAMPLQCMCKFMSVCISSSLTPINQILRCQRPSSHSQCPSLIFKVTDHLILFFLMHLTKCIHLIYLHSLLFLFITVSLSSSFPCFLHKLSSVYDVRVGISASYLKTGS